MENKELIFNEEKHEYYVENKKLISVTQLMKKHGLAPDYSKVSEVVLNRKAQRGTVIHKEIEEWLKNGEIGFTNEFGNFRKYIIDNGILCIGSEYQVHNDIVAGTIDLLLNDNVIADIKTTYSLNKESVRWQLSIYVYLLVSVLPNAKEVYNLYKGEIYHFNKLGELEVVDVKLRDFEDVEELMECERKGVIYHANNIVVANNEVRELLDLEEYISSLQAEIKQLQNHQEELKTAIMDAMKKADLKSIDNEKVKITYIAPSTRKSIDTTLLKEKYPEIAEELTKETSTKEGLKITIRKEKENE